MRNIRYYQIVVVVQHIPVALKVSFLFVFRVKNLHVFAIKIRTRHRMRSFCGLRCFDSHNLHSENCLDDGAVVCFIYFSLAIAIHWQVYIEEKKNETDCFRRDNNHFCEISFRSSYYYFSN